MGRGKEVLAFLGFGVEKRRGGQKSGARWLEWRVSIARARCSEKKGRGEEKRGKRCVRKARAGGKHGESMRRKGAQAARVISPFALGRW